MNQTEVAERLDYINDMTELEMKREIAKYEHVEKMKKIGTYVIVASVLAVVIMGIIII